ncbi:MAG: hypothetical protein ACK4UN_20290, partial [Limisphaerales bacterium]
HRRPESLLLSKQEVASDSRECHQVEERIALSESEQWELIDIVNIRSAKGLSTNRLQYWLQSKGLNPLEIYGHRGNVVIALKRDAQEERGYYICPAVSSYIPFSSRNDHEWTWRKWDPDNPFSMLFAGEYVRKRQESASH